MKGWQKTSFIDVEGKIASVFFYGGCNFRCSYCHNPDLVINAAKLPEISEEEVLDYIKKKINIYEAVCISGGEPTLNPNLTEIIKKIRTLNLAVKIDSNGTNLSVIKELIDQDLIQYVALDIKTSYKKYNQVFIQGKEDPKLLEQVKKTIEFLKKQDKIDYEFRSTLYPPFFTEDDLKEIANMVKGAKKYFLQQFNPKNTLTNLNGERPFTMERAKQICQFFKPFVERCEIR
ncbi:MAG: anaerobic ribonucleoside-triphosphate reductase activating protein [Candidatus Margulisbacteria bacterium]|nr:anaerobic ribonucleoside-triphosphate reductase activating protein [Candidatus Margulisiibacteriota bacterium]